MKHLAPMASNWSAPTCCEWCSVPNSSATLAAYDDSSAEGTSKPIEQVLTGERLASAISATTLEESTPPDRKAPSGTSATIRLVTASRI